MNERRRAGRMCVDMAVRKYIKGEILSCRACEISPTGIRLERTLGLDSGEQPISIEVPLVEGRLTTAVPARRVWRNREFEAFQFISPSFAQQAMLERMFGNY